MSIGPDPLSSILASLPPEVATRIAMAQGMATNPLQTAMLKRAIMSGPRAVPRTSMGGPSVPPAMLPETTVLAAQGGGQSGPTDTGAGTNVQLPFPGVGQGLPPGHPANGFLDRFALGLAGMPMPQVSPYATTGDQFLGGLIRGAAQGWAGNRVAPILQNQQFMDEQSKLRAEMNKANIQARLQAANEANKPQSLLPLMNPDGTLAKDAKGNNVMVRPELANYMRQVAEMNKPPKLSPEFSLTHHKDPKTGQWVPNKASDEGLGDDYFKGLVETEGGGRQYLDVSQFNPKDKAAAQKWAVDNGVSAVGKDQADAVRQVDNAKRNLTLLQGVVTKFLPPDWQSRPGAVPKIMLKKFLQQNGAIASYGAWRSAAIQMMRAAAGSKGLRINQAEILQSAANDIPQLTDDLPTALARIQAMMDQLDSVVYANLVRNRSAQQPYMPKSAVPR